jgi:hypothetical protein
MPYPGQFHRLVMIGDHYSDTFNMTLSIVPDALGELGMPPVDDATIAAVAAKITPWFGQSFSTPAAGFHTISRLTSIKLNRIGTDGHYVDNDAKEYIYPSPIVGNQANNPVPQLATVVTLGTALERGRGSKGRVYLLPNLGQNSLGTDGRISQAQATQVATAFRQLVRDINSTYALIGRVGVASNAGAGRFEHVTRIGVGRVVDTMRSRRSALVEDHQFVTV